MSQYCKKFQLNCLGKITRNFFTPWIISRTIVGTWKYLYSHWLRRVKHEDYFTLITQSEWRYFYCGTNIPLSDGNKTIAFDCLITNCNCNYLITDKIRLSDCLIWCNIMLFKISFLITVLNSFLCYR